MIDDTQAKIDANTIMALGVANLLGDGTYKPNQVYHYQFQVVAPDGSGLIVNTSDRTHFSVGCLWPCVDNREYAPESRPHIKVAKARGLEGLFKDIEKKILSQYAAEFNRQRERGLKEQADRNARQAMIREFSALAGCKSVDEQELQSGCIRGCHHNIYRVEVGEGGTVAVHTYHMPAEVARKVIALIRELNPDA